MAHPSLRQNDTVHSTQTHFVVFVALFFVPTPSASGEDTAAPSETDTPSDEPLGSTTLRDAIAAWHAPDPIVMVRC